MDRNTFAPVLTILLTASLVFGCAHLRKGPTEQELIASSLEAWKAATEAQNPEGMMACISEDFQWEEGGKAQMRAFLEGFIREGNLSGALMNLANSVTTLEEESARVQGITLSSDAGSIQLELVMKKDPDGAWRIASLDAY